MLNGVSDIDIFIVVEDTELPSIIDVKNLVVYDDQYEALLEKWTSFLIHLDYVTDVWYYDPGLVLGARLSMGTFEVDLDLSFTSDVIGRSDLDYWYRRMVLLTSPKEKILFLKPVLLLSAIEEKTQDSCDDLVQLHRLLKHWEATIVNPVLRRFFHDDHHGIMLQLLVRYMWESAGSPPEFDLLCGYKIVLQTLAEDLNTIRYYWTEYYNASIAEISILILSTRESVRPLLFSPLDPTTNILHYKSVLYTDVIAETARQTLKSALLNNIKEVWNNCD
ncbi:uncharacterized protein [Amphiura filiformis]|uniref:uncharacterized protein n=1 Tax=Amphiura filiformis TaxID=82378 RepID=UPI003B2157F4